MDDQNVRFRRIEKNDNREIAELIRTVFREFKIDKPGTVYFDPTTDRFSSYFVSKDLNTGLLKPEGRSSEGVVFIQHPDYLRGVQNLLSCTFRHLTGVKVSGGSL